MIISNEFPNALDLDLIVVPITKTIRGAAFSLVIQPSDVTGDLPVASELRCNKPFTIRRQLIYDKIGVLNQERTTQAVLLVAEATQIPYLEDL